MIIGPFFHYDGMAAPHWPLDLSLNSVLSFLSHLIIAMIARIIYSTIYQLLYLFYHEISRDIRIIEVFAKAAYTVRGAFGIIRLQRFWGLASFLAIAHVISQGMPTNVQQAISLRPEMKPFGEGTVPVAKRASRQLSSSSSIANLDDGLLEAMWSGFLGPIDEIPHPKLSFLEVGITSLPKWRETHCAEKNDGYFDFKHLKLCAHIDISHMFV